jgi:hypothetical protein
MDPERRPFGRSYLRLVAVGILTAVLVALLGYWPTVRMAGPGAVGAMLVGIAASLLAGLVGAVPVGLAAAAEPGKVPQAVMASTALRFIVVLGAAAAVILSGRFDRVVVAVWIAVSYMIMLVVDTAFAIRVVAAGRRQQQ